VCVLRFCLMCTFIRIFSLVSRRELLLNQITPPHGFKLSFLVRKKMFFTLQPLVFSRVWKCHFSVRLEWTRWQSGLKIRRRRSWNLRFVIVWKCYEVAFTLTIFGKKRDLFVPQPTDPPEWDAPICPHQIPQSMKEGSKDKPPNG